MSIYLNTKNISKSSKWMEWDVRGWFTVLEPWSTSVEATYYVCVVGKVPSHVCLVTVISILWGYVVDSHLVVLCWWAMFCTMLYLYFCCWWAMFLRCYTRIFVVRLFLVETLPELRSDFLIVNSTIYLIFCFYVATLLPGAVCLVVLLGMDWSVKWESLWCPIPASTSWDTIGPS
jgi:hypothetical protein